VSGFSSRASLGTRNADLLSKIAKSIVSRYVVAAKTANRFFVYAWGGWEYRKLGSIDTCIELWCNQRRQERNPAAAGQEGQKWIRYKRAVHELFAAHEAFRPRTARQRNFRIPTRRVGAPGAWNNPDKCPGHPNTDGRKNRRGRKCSYNRRGIVLYHQLDIDFEPYEQWVSILAMEIAKRDPPRVSRGGLPIVYFHYCRDPGERPGHPPFDVR
jgi:hypothetical protein